MKLPPEQRPPFKTISDTLDSKISRKFQNLFVVDIQNDCGCDTEEYYSNNIKTEAIYLDKGQVKIKDMIWLPCELGNEVYKNNICLPMNDDISEYEILSLLELACKNSGNEILENVCYKILYNKQIDPIKFQEVYKKYIGEITFNRSGHSYWAIDFDFVPTDKVYCIPQPEYFGLISANIGKFGAMCFTENIISIDLN